jgi:hypothetical protein
MQEWLLTPNDEANTHLILGSLSSESEKESQNKFSLDKKQSVLHNGTKISQNMNN